MTTTRAILSSFLMLALAGACGDNDISDNPSADAGDEADAAPESDGGGNVVPDNYAFDSRFGDGSSVSYSGQVLRQVLIEDMEGYLKGLTARIDGGDAPEDIVADLNFYYQFADTGATVEIAMDPGLPLAQTTYGDISAAKDLRGKIAGQDATGQHKDWATELVGFDGSPDELVQSWFQEIADLAAARASVNPLDVPTRPDGTPISEVYVSEAGLDYQELLAKFLMVSVGFSQASDDYLDDADADHGLNVSNAQDGDKLHSALEHHWDEGFGYFGAARTYGQLTDEEIGEGYDDADGSGDLDLLSEVNFALASYAARRDLGSAEGSRTDFSGEAMDGFLTGRAIIANAGETLTDDEMADLLAARDQAIGAWEKTIAANTIHYINSTLADMDTFETPDDYSFESHAAHWSEMKGFSLGLQFNPRSPLSDEDFAALQTAIGTAPVLSNADAADITAYRAALEDARAILAAGYGFADANVQGW